MRIQFDRIGKLSVGSLTIQLFYLLIATDIIFILLHLIHKFTDFASSPLLSLETEGGHSEVFQYIKEFWIAILLGFLARKKHSALYFSWFLLFLYLLLDDSLQVHERLGRLLSIQLGFSSLFNLRSVDFGELLISGTIGLFFLLFIAVAYRRADRSSRNASKGLILLLFALAICGIGFDMLHSILYRFDTLEIWLSALEDGGELIVMSTIISFAFELTQTEVALKPSERQLTKTTYDRQ